METSDSESNQSNIGDSCGNNNLTKKINDNSNCNNNDNSTDDYKRKLLECSKESKLKQEQENPEILNKSCKIALHSIKAANSPPSTQTDLTTDNNDLNEDRNINITNNNNTTNKLCSSIKREKTCAINANPSITITTTSGNTNCAATPPLDNTTKLIDSNKTIVCEKSLSPLRQNLQSNCLNGSDNKTNNNNNNTSVSSNKNLLLAKSLEEKRPKSVTASVFRPATLADLSGTHTTTATATPLSPPLPTLVPSTTSTSSVFVNAANAPSLPPLNAAPRAQSVTASVFTPISQLCNRQQQHIAKTNSIITPTTVTAAILSGQQQHHQNHQNSQTPTQQTQDMNKFLSFGDETNELTSE